MRRSLAVLVPSLLAACSPPASEAPTAQANASTPEASAAPATTPAPEPTREEDIRRYLLQTYPDAAPMRYALAWHDLDGDGAEEALIYLVTSYYCGSGGCPTLVLTPAGPVWREVGNISVSRTPVSVLDSKTNGWKDITVDISGGGAGSGIALLKFDGKAYPRNPTVPPATPAKARGTVVIAEEPEMMELAVPSGE